VKHDDTFGEPVRQALRGWEQRVQAVIEIGRDSDDLPARLPVLDALAHELVVDLGRAIEGLDAVSHHSGVELPRDADTLRDALGKAYALLHDIALWHRPPSVGALRKARDSFSVAAVRIESRRDVK